MKARIFFEFAYLGICIFSIYEAIRYSNTPDKQSFYMYVFFAAASLAMFFLRRKTRKRYEDKNSKS